MGLFGKLFSKEEKKSCCDVKVVEVVKAEEEVGPNGRKSSAATPITLTILGPGCKRCHQLEENARKAGASIAKEVQIKHVTDPAAIADTGVLSTPALLVNGKVVSQGKVLTPEEILHLL